MIAAFINLADDAHDTPKIIHILTMIQTLILLMAHITSHFMNINNKHLFYHYFEADRKNSTRYLWIGDDPEKCKFKVQAPNNAKLFEAKEHHECFIKNAYPYNNHKLITNVSILNSTGDVLTYASRIMSVTVDLSVNAK